MSKGGRLLSLAAVLCTAVVSRPAAAAPRGGVPVNVLIVADVGESAQRSMPAALWRKLVVEYVGARTATAEDGTALPDEARCRAAHAFYAIFATFERAMRLPGLGQDPDRIYGIARFSVRNCMTGVVSPTKTVRVESDPLSDADRGDYEAVSERTWDHAIRATLARDPLMLSAVARVVRVENGVVYLESGGGFSVNQVLRDFADADAKPYATPIQLVVQDVSGKLITAGIIGKGTPRAGDYVDAAAH